MRLSDETLRGRTVIAADGQAIGEVAALFLDSDAWRVESLQIKLRKKLLTSSALRGTYSTLGHWNCLYAWFSRSATPSSSRSRPWSCGRFSRARVTPPPATNFHCNPHSSVCSKVRGMARS